MRMTDDFSNLGILHNCLSSIKDWIGLNFLKLNSGKTKLLIVSHEITTMYYLCALCLCFPFLCNFAVKHTFLLT